MLCISSLLTCETGVPAPSLALGRPPLTAHPPFGEAQAESYLGGDCFEGRSVRLSAAGMPRACLDGRTAEWYFIKLFVSRGEVGDTFMGVPVGEYWVDFLYAWCWYGAWCAGMAVAVENWVAMACDGGWNRPNARRLTAYTVVEGFEGFFEGMELIRADSGGEGPWAARVQRGRIQSDRSRRKRAITADSRAVRLSTLEKGCSFGVEECRR
jgi:hypothetical protein